MHVHFFTTVLLDVARAALLPMLSDEERVRADRFRFARDREHFIAAHAGLRLLLARYGAGPPGTLAFSRGSAGKPRLAAGPHFSLSHAGDMAAGAVSATLDVGVDLETPPAEEDPELFASVCSHDERLLLHSLPAPERPWAFTRMWVVKEALVKAHGSGLLIPLSALSISLSNPLQISPPAWNGVPWFAAELAPPPGYAAALATLVRAPVAVRLFSYRYTGAFLAS